MAFNNWPYTNFQDLNLGWILGKAKEAVTKAVEALSTANGADDKADDALSVANGISGVAQNALDVAKQAINTANSIKQPCKLVVSGNTVTYNGEVLNGIDINDLFANGEYPFCVYDDGDGTTYVYKPDVYAVLANIYTQSFTCITPASAAGEDYELLKRLVIINGVPQFATDIELASTDYVDSQSIDGAVLYTEQSPTSSEKRQARSNIGAGTSTVTVSNNTMTIANADTGSVTAYPIGGSGLPNVTAADNGKFLRVVSGAWAAATVPNAETNSFGP